MFTLCIENKLIGTVIDLFCAGLETTSNTIGNPHKSKCVPLDLVTKSHLINFTYPIGWAIIFLIHYPEVQTKLHIELDQICRDDLPILKDRPR